MSYRESIMRDDENADTPSNQGGTTIPFMYFVYVGVIVLTYFFGWIVLAIFIALLVAAWLFAWFDDKRYASTDTKLVGTLTEYPAAPDSDGEYKYIDEHRCCLKCGSKMFTVEYGVTTAEEIIAFASHAADWKENPEAVAGWMPPGIYCPLGCFAIHTTPAGIPNSSGLLSELGVNIEIDGVPKPARIRFADVMRDGGSYVLAYDSENSLSVKILLRVIMTDKFQRIGYQKPQLTITDAISLKLINTRIIDWDDAKILGKLLAPLLSPFDKKIGGGGIPRATEMLHYLSLRGELR